MLSDSRVAALMQDWSTDPTTYQLIVLHRVDASEIKEKKVLTLACMYLDWDLRSMIVEYNKTNDEYRINVVDYTSTRPTTIITPASPSSPPRSSAAACRIFS